MERRRRTGWLVMTDLHVAPLLWFLAGVVLYALAPYLGKGGRVCDLVGRVFVWLGAAALILATTGAHP